MCVRLSLYDSLDSLWGIEPTEYLDIGFKCSRILLGLISISDFLYIGSLQLVPLFGTNSGSFALSLGREAPT